MVAKSKVFDPCRPSRLFYIHDRCSNAIQLRITGRGLSRSPRETLSHFFTIRKLNNCKSGLGTGSGWNVVRNPISAENSKKKKQTLIPN